MAVTNKEKNFASAIVYVHNDAELLWSFLETLYRFFETHFEKYEVICVNDNSADHSVSVIREFVQSEQPQRPLTVINMSISQGMELAMNAGIDCAIGDFIFEFDSPQMDYPEEFILRSYQTALSGYDIVSVCPEKTCGMMGKLFYRLFNRYSHSQYDLRTDAFRLVSRRAVNRVHAINPTMAYRKAAYAASGLKVEQLIYPAERTQNSRRAQKRTDLALDSLALYTDAAYKLAFYISLLFLGITFCGAVYTVAVYLMPNSPVAGWTTTMLLLSGGFFGVFLLLTLILKYLSLLVDLVFRKQKYLVESVEKIQGEGR